MSRSSAGVRRGCSTSCPSSSTDIRATASPPSTLGAAGPGLAALAARLPATVEVRYHRLAPGRTPRHAPRRDLGRARELRNGRRLVILDQLPLRRRPRSRVIVVLNAVLVAQSQSYCPHDLHDAHRLDSQRVRIRHRTLDHELVTTDVLQPQHTEPTQQVFGR